MILPGIGYTCDKPLLYYSGKLARSLGYEVLPVPYGGFPPKVRGDQARLLECAEIALAQTDSMLREIDWSRYEDILFFSKSIGTAAAVQYAYAHGIHCRHVLYTPLEETFSCPVPNAAAFHGTADPWADTERIRALCEEHHIPLYITERANHSLETGDPERDLNNLLTVMRQAKGFVLSGLS